MLLKNLDLLPSMASSLLVLALGLLALVDTIRHRAVVKKHLGCLSVLSLAYLVLCAGVFVAYPSAMVEAVRLYIVLGMAAVGAGLVFVFGAVGVAACEELGIADMPLLRAALEGRALPDPLLSKRHAFDTARLVVLASAFALVVSSLAGMTLEAGLEGQEWAFLRMGAEIGLPRVFFLAAIALGGEVAIRLGVQNWLARVLKLEARRYWIAVVVAAAIWARIPFQQDAPSWYEFAVRLPVGIGLGFLFKRYGFETSLAAHGAFLVIYHSLKEYVDLWKVI